MPRALVFVALPPLLTEILARSIASEPGLRVLGEFDDHRAAIRTLRAEEVDGVVLARPSPNPCQITEILETWPGARVLTIVGHGRGARLVELVPETQELDDVSAETLVEALRRPRS